MKKNKLCWIGSVLALCWITAATQPSKTKFEADRSVLLQRIKDIRQILLQTANKKKKVLTSLMYYVHRLNITRC